MITDGYGRALSEYEYFPYGRIKWQRHREGTHQWQSTQDYTGHQKDKETGLHYAMARYLSTRDGRFTSVDPSRESVVKENSQSWNRYGYVLGNPLKLIDKKGEEVYVGWHPAFIHRDENPYMHLTLVLKPRKVSDFSNLNLFKNSSGKQRSYATLGAQLEGDFNPPSAFGTLVSTPNYPGDDPSKLLGYEIVETPQGMTDTEFIKQLVKASYRYGNDANYDPIGPSLGIFYNSNSYIAGVIEAAGGDAPDIPCIATLYNAPLPIPNLIMP